VTTAALRADARACHAAAVAAAEAGSLVAARLRRDGEGLSLAGPGDVGTLCHPGPVVIVGAGKAADAMAAAAVAVVGDSFHGGALVLPRGGAGPAVPGLEIGHGGHPLPDAGGVAATERLLTRVREVGPDTLLLVVLSGGASALLVAPAAGIDVADKRQLTASLLAAGADIMALNTVRKHCSRVKGGGLLMAAARARAVWTLVLSDVVGDDPAVIASGPTVADPTTFADAAIVLERHLAPSDVPPAIHGHLVRGCAGEVPETLKAGDPPLRRARTVVIGGNREAVTAAAEALRVRGYTVATPDRPLIGDAAAAGRMVVEHLRALPRDRPVALVVGGETTVRVHAGGRGGRCQQLALAAALALAGEAGVLLAAGTDGVDGPTDAAGACVDGETVLRARRCGLDPARALAATDSHPLLEATGDLIRVGPTGTNVADVVVALRGAC
jgi:glycerate-2-kinase